MRKPRNPGINAREALSDYLPSMTRSESVEVTPTDSLADAIIKISEGMTALRRSGLNTHAITVLLHDHTKVPRGHINAVLNGLADLKGRFCK